MDPDQRLGMRLTLAFVATFVLGVPFLVLLLLVRDSWTPLLDLDRDVADSLHRVALRHAALVDLLKLISTVFDPLTFRLVATALAGWLLYLRRFRLGAWVLVTGWGSALLG